MNSFYSSHISRYDSDGDDYERFLGIDMNDDLTSNEFVCAKCEEVGEGDGPCIYCDKYNDKAIALSKMFEKSQGVSYEEIIEFSMDNELDYYKLIEMFYSNKSIVNDFFLSVDARRITKLLGIDNEISGVVIKSNYKITNKYAPGVYFEFSVNLCYEYSIIKELKDRYEKNNNDVFLSKNSVFVKNCSALVSELPIKNFEKYLGELEDDDNRFPTKLWLEEITANMRQSDMNNINVCVKKALLLYTNIISDRINDAVDESINHFLSLLIETYFFTFDIVGRTTNND